jgi:hypothetical protein
MTIWLSTWVLIKLPDRNVTTGHTTIEMLNGVFLSLFHQRKTTWRLVHGRQWMEHHECKRGNDMPCRIACYAINLMDSSPFPQTDRPNEAEAERKGLPRGGPPCGRRLTETPACGCFDDAAVAPLQPPPLRRRRRRRRCFAASSGPSSSHCWARTVGPASLVSLVRSGPNTYYE